MAELDTSGGGKKGGKVRSKKASTRVDLTAMVDLAFLLITFFILTTTLSKPKAMDLAMPDKDDKTKAQMPVKESETMTILLGKDNQLAWFVGIPGKTAPTKDNYGKNGIRKSLIEQAQKIKAATGDDMIVIVKPSDKSVYANMVTVMDELNILGNKQRAIGEITNPELEMMKQYGLY